MALLQPSSLRPPKNLVLEAVHIRLQPVNAETDLEELFLVAGGEDKDDAIWKYMPQGPFSDITAFKEYLLSVQNSDAIVGFVVVDKPSNKKIGIVTFMNIVPQHRSVEIGGIWYIPQFHRTYANTESAYLLIKYAFEELKYRRVEWKCNDLNEKSKRAAQRLGFKYEGTFRQHFIIKGANRDTSWFSIIDSEWEGTTKPHLEALVNLKV